MTSSAAAHTCDADSTQWLRPANMFEQIMDKIQAASGTMLTCYCLTVNSRQPLDAQHVAKALHLIYRRIITLRLCIRPRPSDQDKIWMVELQNEKIDFEIIGEDDFTSTFREMTRTSYLSSEGPLWKVRMTSGSVTSVAARAERQIPLAYEKEHKILFGFHHAITDGHSSLRICGYFMKFLNDIICGRSVEESAQLAEFADSDANLRECFGKVIESAKLHPEESEKYIKEFDEMAKQPVLILDAYPVTEKVTSETFNIRSDFDCETSKKFLAKCKSNGVTCHTGFFTVTQMALVDILLDAGVDQERYAIATNHVINGRRFWNKDINASIQFGSNILLLPTNFSISKNAKSMFWETCKDYHKLFFDGLNDNYPIKYILRTFSPMQTRKEQEDGALPVNAYYNTTNMGDITNILTGDFCKTDPSNKTEDNAEDEVIVTDFTRSTSTHASSTIWSHVLQSFKGRMLYSMDYNSDLAKHTTARKYVEAIERLVKFAVEN